jgi:hypothetical protein
MTQSDFQTILWAVIEVTAFLVAAIAAFWLARRAETNRKKFARAVGVLVVYSIVVTLGYAAWILDSNYTILGAIYLGILIGAFHFVLMAVITGGLLFVTRPR